MIALPVALFIMSQIGAFTFRPDVEEINQLSLLLSMSQLLIIPLLIAMYQKRHFTLIPFIFSGAGAVHFLLYTWLYQTVIYIVMSILIAVVLAVCYGTNQKNDHVSKTSAANVCFSTGFILIATGIYFFLLL